MKQKFKYFSIIFITFFIITFILSGFNINNSISGYIDSPFIDMKFIINNWTNQEIIEIEKATGNIQNFIQDFNIMCLAILAFISLFIVFILKIIFVMVYDIDIFEDNVVNDFYDSVLSMPVMAFINILIITFSPKIILNICRFINYLNDVVDEKMWIPFVSAIIILVPSIILIGLIFKDLIITLLQLIPITAFWGIGYLAGLSNYFINLMFDNFLFMLIFYLVTKIIAKRIYYFICFIKSIISE